MFSTELGASAKYDSHVNVLGEVMVSGVFSILDARWQQSPHFSQ